MVEVTDGGHGWVDLSVHEKALAAEARWSALEAVARAERDAARECVRRLYQWASGHQHCWQLTSDPEDSEELEELRAILDATPEHLR